MTKIKLPEDDAQFTPRDFAAIIAHLPEDCPMVDGQAVAWWLARSKQKAQQLKCISNLRQIGIALQSFVADNHAYPSTIAPSNGDFPGLWESQLQSGGFGNPQPVTNFINQGVWKLSGGTLVQSLAALERSR